MVQETRGVIQETVFKTVAFVRSAILPGGAYRTIGLRTPSTRRLTYRQPPNLGSGGLGEDLSRFGLSIAAILHFKAYRAGERYAEGCVGKGPLCVDLRPTSRVHAALGSPNPAVPSRIATAGSDPGSSGAIDS